MENKGLILFVLLLLITSVIIMNKNAILLPYYLLLSILRMTGAYVASLIFSLTLGIWMAHNERAFRYLFPIMDILQSVPILAFLPFAILFVINFIPIIGAEAATLFLIFTCMVWSTLFNVIEGVRSIPSTMRYASRLMNLKGIDYLRNVVFPAIYPALVSGSMAGWGGAWYFLVVGENTRFGEVIHQLPGIGYFISDSAYSGNIIYSLLGIWALSAVVLIINRFLWRPLLMKAKRYTYDESAGVSENLSIYNNWLVINVEKLSDSLNFVLSKVLRTKYNIFKTIGIDPSSKVSGKSSRYSIFLFVLVIIAIVYLLFFVGTTFVSALQLFIYSGASLLRIFIAYLIALTWTLIIGLWIGRNAKLMRMLMPIFDIGQSIPAVAVFPIIVVTVISLIGGNLGIEIASIALLLTGMQWYLLFNIIRAYKSIPDNMLQVSSLLRLSNLHKLRHIILPALLPAIIIGSVQAFGGGWNATIVSEYVIYQDQAPFHPEEGGLGYLLMAASAKGDLVALTLGVLTMVAIIIAMNRLVWNKALKKCQHYKLS